MHNVLYTELLKLKRTNIVWLTIIGAVLPALLAVFGQLEKMDWSKLFINNLLFLNMMIVPLLISLLAGFVVVREYKENTINQLFVFPHRRVTILIGKTIVLLILLAIMVALNFLLVWLSGSIMSNVPIPTEDFWKFTRAFVWMFALWALLIPVMMSAGIVGKSFIPPVVLGVIAILINMMGLQGVEDHIDGRVTLVSFLPFGSMIIHLLDIMKSNVDSAIYRVHVLYPQGAVFVLFFLFNALYFSKSEVHSGS